MYNYEGRQSIKADENLQTQVGKSSASKWWAMRVHA